MTEGQSPLLNALCWTVTLLACLPAILGMINLWVFRRPFQPTRRHAVSVIVPARNEEAGVAGCLAALRASDMVEIEIIVVDDQSEDQTAQVVRDICAADERVMLRTAPALPPGWAGKQHACYVGAEAARHPVLLFLDCDVRPSPVGVATLAEALARSSAALVSGFPRQLTGTLGELVLIPLIHVVLLGYLPFIGMRRSRRVGYGAGCGQIMVADAAAYRAVGGHAAIRGSWHDGLHLPRTFRGRGYTTDICDATAIADCRMYQGLAETWRGLAKNAHEGMARSRALPLWTLLLGGGLVAPFVLLPVAWLAVPGSSGAQVLTIVTCALMLVRAIIALRFRQGLIAIPLLPVGILAFLVLQWRVLLRQGGNGRTWRGRTQFLP